MTPITTLSTLLPIPLLHAGGDGAGADAGVAAAEVLHVDARVLCAGRLAGVAPVARDVLQAHLRK